MINIRYFRVKDEGIQRKNSLERVLTAQTEFVWYVRYRFNFDVGVDWLIRAEDNKSIDKHDSETVSREQALTDLTYIKDVLERM